MKGSSILSSTSTPTLHYMKEVARLSFRPILYRAANIWYEGGAQHVRRYSGFALHGSLGEMLLEQEEVVPEDPNIKWASALHHA